MAPQCHSVFFPSADETTVSFLCLPKKTVRQRTVIFNWSILDFPTKTWKCRNRRSRCCISCTTKPIWCKTGSSSFFIVLNLWKKSENRLPVICCPYRCAKKHYALTGSLSRYGGNSCTMNSVWQLKTNQSFVMEVCSPQIYSIDPKGCRVLKTVCCIDVTLVTVELVWLTDSYWHGLVNGLFTPATKERFHEHSVQLWRRTLECPRNRLQCAWIFAIARMWQSRHVPIRNSLVKATCQCKPHSTHLSISLIKWRSTALKLLV